MFHEQDHKLKQTAINQEDPQPRSIGNNRDNLALAALLAVSHCFAEMQG